MDIVITIPKKIEWKDYLKEIEAVRDGSQVMLYKLPFKPKCDLVGSKCFVCWRGHIVGWMNIVDVIYSDGFTCTTTNTPWPEGWYVARSGEWTYLQPGIPMKGFQGIRYVKDELKDKIDKLI